VLSGYLFERFRRKEFVYLKQISMDMDALQDVNDKLRHLSYHDSLTGVSNRRYFDEHLSSEWQRAVRFGYPLSLLIIDIDDFKAFNDRYGHIMGDEALKKVAAVLNSLINRSGDIVARYGGEEFVVLMIGADENGSDQMAGEILSRLKILSLPHDMTERGILTVSIGVSTMLPALELQADELLRRADQALYRAKKGGKDRFCRWE
jgi:diguanylate cyclase (GGDEF)-like protein